jgi:phospholipase C
MVDHIVVLIMENRSFDHLLGYLSLPAALQAADPAGRSALAVDGLRDERALADPQKVFANHHEGRRVPRASSRPHGAHQGRGPDHSEHGIHQPLSEGNGGFVGNFVATRKHPVDPGIVMG